MREKEVLIQNFNGKEYFLYDNVEFNGNKYSIFMLVENPQEIIVAKEVEENKESFYEIIEEEERDAVLSLFKE